MAYFQPPSRVESLDQRIRDADRFPRIDEAMAKIAVVKKKKEDERKGGHGVPKKSKGQLLVEAAKAEIAEQMASPAKKMQYFNTFTVNDDPSISKDLLYDEVVYPKLFNDSEEIPADAIERLWMAGFLDRAQRDAKLLETLPPPKFLTDRDKGIRRREKEAATKTKKKAAKGTKQIIAEAIAKRRPSQLDFVESEDDEPKKGPLRPKLCRKKDKKDKAGGGSSPPKGPNPNDAFKAIDALESPPGSPTATLHRQGGSVADMGSDSVVISAADEERLKALENKALGLNEDGTDPMKSGRAIKMLRAQGIKAPAFTKKKLTREERLQKNVDAKIAIYSNEAKRIKELIRPTRKPDPEAEFYSKELEYIFEVERVENEAASRIQRFYRDVSKLYKMREVVFAMLQARTIQKMVRGMVTRKWLAPWFLKRAYLTVKWQASFRRWRSNKYWGMQETLERTSVVLLQRRWRGWLGRTRHREKKWTIACTVVQALWRGVVSRARADKTWLNKTVVPIQVLARKMIAKRKVNDFGGDLDKAALKIQMRFRMYRSKMKMGKRLQEREMQYREDVITMIVAEEEWCADQLVKMASRIGRNTLKPELERAAKEMHEMFDQENDFMETSRQREILSPRAISQGWVVELDKKVVSLRDQITNYKMDVLFHKCLKVNVLEHQLESKVVEIEEMAARRQKWSEFRFQENADRVSRDYVSNVGNMRKEMRQRTADEKRRWRVLYTTSDGKPDKRRRPGRAWDPSVLAQPDRQTLNPQVDLLAEINSETELFKPGTNESVDQSLRRAALQRYLDQVNAYEGLMTPLADVMKINLGGAPAEAGGTAPEDLGYGKQMGPLLPTALADIGATPGHWNQGTDFKEGRTMQMVAVMKQRGHTDKHIMDTITKLGMTVPANMPLSPLGNGTVGHGSPMGMGAMSPSMSPFPGGRVQVGDGLNLGFSDSFDMTQASAAGMAAGGGGFGGEGVSVACSRHLGVDGDDMSMGSQMSDASYMGQSMGGTLHSTMGASMAQYSQLTGAGASAFPGLDESMSVGLESIESEFDRANRMAEAEHAAKRARMKAARRAERRPKPVTIPWRLLDELEGEKRKFQRENALRELSEETLRRKKEDKFLPHLAAKRKAKGGGK